MFKASSPARGPGWPPLAWLLLALGLSPGSGLPAQEPPPLPPLQTVHLPGMDFAQPGVVVKSFVPPEGNQRLTLPRLLELAAQNNPDLAVARARAENARGRLIQAGLYINPIVTPRS